MALYVVLNEKKRGGGRADLYQFIRRYADQRREHFSYTKNADIPVRADICRVISHQVPSGTKSPPVVFVGFLLAHLRITALAVFFFSDFSSVQGRQQATLSHGAAQVPYRLFEGITDYFCPGFTLVHFLNPGNIAIQGVIVKNSHFLLLIQWVN